MNVIAGKLFGVAVLTDPVATGVVAGLPDCSINAWKFARGRLARKRNWRSGI